MAKTEAVSYTHLDVYKRQVLDRRNSTKAVVLWDELKQVTQTTEFNDYILKSKDGFSTSPVCISIFTSR